MKTFTSREFNQDVSKIKREASNGPVFITDRGHVAHVLLTIEDYQKLTGSKKNIVDLLSTDEVAAVDFEIPTLRRELFHKKGI